MYYIDHIAVALFLDAEDQVPSLTLHLPARWIADKYCFHDNGDDSENPGRRLNQLHKRFSEKLKHNSLEDIGSALALGARACVHDGFHQRNEEVAKSDYVIAIAWGEGAQPQKGGTLDTWKKCRTKNKRYISYESLSTSHKPVLGKRSSTLDAYFVDKKRKKND